MQVITAKTAGFCFGVKRAVDLVYNNIGEKVFTYGPIIHNEEVVKDLESKGVQVIDEKGLETLPAGATVVIRSHGASKEVYDRIRESGAQLIDATCPFVAKIHEIVRNSPGPVIIVGDPRHPEVEGICGWAKDETFVIQTTEDFRALEEAGRIDKKKTYSIVAQTTFHHEKYKEIVANIEFLNYDIKYYNTVCNATQERQREALEIASQVDAMVVIGSKLSSNTRKLYDICTTACNVTWFVSSANELQHDNFNSVDSVGITAGASTPKHIIEEVQTYVRS